MMNLTTAGIGRKTLGGSWRGVRTLVFGGSLLLWAGLAVAQDKLAPSLEPWDKTKFDQGSVAINNPWMPMTPGTKFVYEGTTVDDDSGKLVPHRVEINITDLTKVIDGVRTLLTYDLDFADGKLTEAELGMFAQDNAGNVWRMGEYVEEYENGKITKVPVWIHGFEDAQGGIMMKADPKLWTLSYAQGWGPAVGWADRGQVHQMGKIQKTKAGTYKDVLVIKETSAHEGGAYQLKYYARGVGNVFAKWAGGDRSRETLELVRIEQMSPKAMDAVRARAQRLEKNAYVQSKKVYALTPPAERLK